jgi:hypothetical protein
LQLIWLTKGKDREPDFLDARDVTPAQRARLISKRKTAYEATDPETKQGGAKGAGKGNGKAANLAGLQSFASQRGQSNATRPGPRR